MTPAAPNAVFLVIEASRERLYRSDDAGESCSW